MNLTAIINDARAKAIGIIGIRSNGVGPVRESSSRSGGGGVDSGMGYFDVRHGVKPQGAKVARGRSDVVVIHAQKSSVGLGGASRDAYTARRANNHHHLAESLELRRGHRNQVDQVQSHQTRPRRGIASRTEPCGQNNPPFSPGIPQIKGHVKTLHVAPGRFGPHPDATRPLPRVFKRKQIVFKRRLLHTRTLILTLSTHGI